MLRKRADDLYGIINGINYEIFNSNRQENL